MTGMGSDTSPAAAANKSVAAADFILLDRCSSPTVSVEVVFEDDMTGEAGDQQLSDDQQLDAEAVVDVNVEEAEDIPENCSSSLGFTAAQEIVFSNGRVDGQRVMVLNSEVARSLGVSQGSEECPDDTTFSAGPPRTSQPRSLDLRVTTEVTDNAESQSVSVSLAEFDDDGMLDPDQFLEMELASGKAEVTVDEDLTSLSWLQSRNLLKDIQLRPSMPGLVRLPAGSAAGGMDIVEAAVTAAAADVEQRDLADLNDDDPGCQIQSPRRRKWQRRPGGGRRGSAKSQKQAARTASLESAEVDGGVPVRPARRPLPPRPPPHVAYNPQIDVMFKPPFSFSCLIFMAIEDVPVKAMPVRDIYDWISSHFPFYNGCSNGWKNSVRHNLSLNQCFCKVDGVRCCGKGSLWAVDPLYRTSLLFTLRRSKCVSEQPLVVDGRRLPWASAVECGPCDAVAVNTHRPSCPSASSPGGPLQALQPDSCSINSPQLLQPLSQHARIAGKRRRYLSRTDSPPIVDDVVGATCEDDAAGHNIANPELFPFLARRLGYSSSSSNRGRHRRASLSTGPVVHPPLSTVRRMVTSDSTGCTNRTQHGNGSTPAAAAAGRGVRVIHLGRPKYNDIPTLSEKQKKDRLSMRLVVISRSPADEHTYAAVGDPYGDSDLVVENLPGAYSSRSVPVARKRRRLRRVPGGASALRQIYDDAGRRFVDEGADLLLNLAAGMSRAQSPASCSSATSATASGTRIPAAVAVASSASWDSYDIGSLPTAV